MSLRSELRDVSELSRAVTVATGADAVAALSTFASCVAVDVDTETETMLIPEETNYREHNYHYHNPPPSVFHIVIVN